jgi:hypothetical protein
MYLPYLVKSVLKYGFDLLGYDRYSVRDWPQVDDEMVLRRMFDSHTTAFKVDVGAATLNAF